jgi:hypothetical protein
MRYTSLGCIQHLMKQALSGALSKSNASSEVMFRSIVTAEND